MVPPCSAGGPTAALSGLIASDVVVHGKIVAIEPAFDFKSLRAASIVFVELWNGFPEIVFNGVDQVKFPMHEGKFECDGVTMCTSRSFAVADASPELKIGQEVLVGAWVYRDASQSLGAMEARIFAVGSDGQAAPLTYVNIYSPESFSRGEALSALKQRLGD